MKKDKTTNKKKRAKKNTPKKSTKKNKHRKFSNKYGISFNKYKILRNIFEKELTEYLKHYTIDGKPRKRAHHGGLLFKIFPTHGHLLRFILHYFKTNRTQYEFGDQYGISQQRCFVWAHFLFNVLKAATQTYLPKAKLDDIQNPSELIVLIDATERRIPRPSKNQAEYYSGKKKMHTVKNLVITTKHGWILWTSDTVSGRIHDKKLADLCGLPCFLALVQQALADLGFVGLSHVILPFKKPKGGALTADQKAFNRALSSERVRIEHAFGSVKRFRMLGDTCRLRKAGSLHKIWEIGCGIHNLKMSANQQVSA